MRYDNGQIPRHKPKGFSSFDMNWSIPAKSSVQRVTIEGAVKKPGVLISAFLTRVLRAFISPRLHPVRTWSSFPSPGIAA